MCRVSAVRQGRLARESLPVETVTRHVDPRFQLVGQDVEDSLHEGKIQGTGNGKVEGESA
jgi:hypothetical protein